MYLHQILSELHNQYLSYQILRRLLFAQDHNLQLQQVMPQLHHSQEQLELG